MVKLELKVDDQENWEEKSERKEGRGRIKECKGPRKNEHASHVPFHIA